MMISTVAEGAAVSDVYIKSCDQCRCDERYDGKYGKTLEDCKSICNADENCKGVEHWSGNRMYCAKCSNYKTSAYTDPGSPFFPPSVYKKGCNSDEWECSNGECIPAEWRCDNSF